VAGTACRQAALGDAAEIHKLLLALAPEIPVQVDTLEREEALYALIRNCARSGESWVAEDEVGRIVGFALAERPERGRHYAEHEMVELHYAGVAPEHRGHGIFTELIGKLLTRMVPVATALSPQNRSGAVDRLERLGFRRIGSPGGEHRLRWESGAADL